MTMTRLGYNMQGLVSYAGTNLYLAAGTRLDDSQTNKNLNLAPPHEE